MKTSELAAPEELRFQRASDEAFRVLTGSEPDQSAEERVGFAEFESASAFGPMHFLTSGRQRVLLPVIKAPNRLSCMAPDLDVHGNGSRISGLLDHKQRARRSDSTILHSIPLRHSIPRSLGRQNLFLEGRECRV